MRGNDLWVLDLATKAETRLTSDGSDTILNGTLSWVYWEEIFDRGDTGFWWSPDSSAIAFLRTDESAVDVSLFTDFSPAVPRVIKQRYPRTGGANPTVRLGIADVSGRKTAWMDSSEVPYEYVLGVDWLPDSRSVAVQTTNRAQTKLDVWRFDRATGKTALVLSESDPAFVYQKEIQFSDGGKTWIVTLRERRPHAPLPLRRRRRAPERRDAGPLVGPRTGQLLRRAAGLGLRRRRRAASSTSPSIEKSPLERHLYRIRPDGTGMARITREDGMHRVALSPDRRFYVDTYSNRDTLPSLSLHDISGKSLATLSPQPDGGPRALRPRETGALHDPGARRLRHPGERAEARVPRTLEEVPRPHPRLRRPGRADRAGPLGAATASSTSFSSRRATSSPRSTRAAPAGRARRSRTWSCAG